jgi:hypothetical protein
MEQAAGKFNCPQDTALLPLASREARHINPVGEKVWSDKP